MEKSRDESGAASGVFRVWNQSMVEPGLAMARSFGDKSAREVGVVSEPEIFETILKEEDKFVVLASDGVWEFLTNADVRIEKESLNSVMHIILLTHRFLLDLGSKDSYPLLQRWRSRKCCGGHYQIGSTGMAEGKKKNRFQLELLHVKNPSFYLSA